MKRIIHISDVHFGNNDLSLIAPLRERIFSLKPDLMVISGDLVEHASEGEFQQAHDFLASLPQPQIVIPGNHDLAFYNFWQRLSVGLRTYRRFITDDLSPHFQDDEIAVIGANTSRAWQLRGGSLSSVQLQQLEREFAALPEHLVRILVTHHPFDLPEDENRHLIVGHARRSVAGLAPVTDVLLAGHIHLSSSGSTATRYKTQGHSLAFIQAGTCISNRNKGENNSFNFLRAGVGTAGSKAIVVDRYAWDKESEAFGKQTSTEYQLGKAGWARCEADKAAEVVVAEPTETLQ